jgi:hypothetical protein
MSTKKLKDTIEQRRIMQILRRMTLTKIKKSKKLYSRKNKSWEKN